jgi:UDP:flavonoid glycosyltransferase YjiC (YdhE family)
MHVFILALGTRGDVELFLVLARELAARGHQTTLGTSGFHAALVREAGIEWSEIGRGTHVDLLAVLRSLASLRDKKERTVAYYRRWLQPQVSAALEQVPTLAARADYFLSNLKLVLQRGERVFPGASVTYDPPASLEDLSRYGAGDQDRRILHLVAMNKALVDPEDAWGASQHFTGFWVAGDRTSWQPPADLVHFLQDGPPPVVVTMGSMVMFDSARLLEDLAQALRLIGQRAVVIAGWSGTSRDQVGGGPFCVVEEVPYDWLFPRAACVVHHGGCGTVAAVLRAGIPSILLPQITAQENFGTMLAREHLTTGIFDTQELRPAELALAFHQATTDEKYRQATRAWQEVILGETGVKTAADLIEAHWHAINKGG